jgi:CTP-dependent riboflavin kinase
VTARWVADTVGIERPTAHRRLKELHEDREVERELSPRAVIWWISEDELVGEGSLLVVTVKGMNVSIRVTFADKKLDFCDGGKGRWNIDDQIHKTISI